MTMTIPESPDFLNTPTGEYSAIEQCCNSCIAPPTFFRLLCWNTHSAVWSDRSSLTERLIYDLSALSISVLNIPFAAISAITALVLSILVLPLGGLFNESASMNTVFIISSRIMLQNMGEIPNSVMVIKHTIHTWYNYLTS